METSALLILMLLLGGGSSNDLLDYVPTDAYWKSKDVEPTAPNLMLELNSIKADDLTKPTAIRRLMAIRALGELKSPDAASSLRAQLDSKEMFVSEYAQRAIDTIESKPPHRAGIPPDKMKPDLYMLPEHCGAVAQVRLAPGNPIDLKSFLPKTPDGDAAGADAKSQIDQTVNQLIYVAELIGNVRLDGMTIGVSDSIGNANGFMTIIVRGQYDAAAVKEALKAELPNSKVVGDTEFMTGMMDIIAVAMPSNEQFVFVEAPPPNTNIPFDELAESIKTGKGKLEANEDLNKLIKTVDTAQPLWVAMTVSDNFKQAAPLASLDSLTLVGKIEGAQMKLTATGIGKDADGVKTSVDQFNELITEAKSDMAHEAETNPALQPFADFMNSMEIKADGATATGTATMKRLGQ